MATNVTDDLWRECVAWLTRCKVIPADHKANWPDSEIRVLALTLRDGVILCNLLNSIDPNALDMKDFNRKPQMAQVRIPYTFHSIPIHWFCFCCSPLFFVLFKWMKRNQTQKIKTWTIFWSQYIFFSISKGKTNRQCGKIYDICSYIQNRLYVRSIYVKNVCTETDRESERECKKIMECTHIQFIL